MCQLRFSVRGGNEARNTAEAAVSKTVHDLLVTTTKRRRHLVRVIRTLLEYMNKGEESRVRHTTERVAQPGRNL
jgi:hypothetical protein